jgi:hypothetical protein
MRATVRVSYFATVTKRAFFSYHKVCIECHRACTTQVGEQRLGRHGKPGAGDIMRRWFVTGVWDGLLDNDELCLRSGGRAQMFQYRETIFISPVVQYHPQEVHRNFFLLGSLRFKEILNLKSPRSIPRFSGKVVEKRLNLGISRARTRRHQAYSSSSTVIDVFLRHALAI